ncbi:hypothetical protein PybrP1_003836 [[Pythium] brassicae (nom. inval.)]|nr:hypothetical protein PybrP1_003836 [[Pythium] brassicae (nom. inval.)]
MWGENGSSDYSNVVLNPYAQLSPRSRRKLKNRDQMRQARQKEKDQMVKLRETVARLEAAYLRATQESEGAAAQQSSSGAVAKYADLMSTSSRLKEENFRLKQSLHDTLKTQEALERVFDDYWQTAPASPSSLRDTLDDTDGTGFAHASYVPMTTDESWLLIRETHKRIRWVQQSLARRAQEPPLGPRGELPSYCGWTIRYHTQDGALLFAFEKAFGHVPALRAMEQMWQCELAMKSYRNDEQAASQSLEIVQHVNEDTYVFQRRLRAPRPRASVTTTYMRFRLKTARGYLLCAKDLESRDRGGAAGFSAALETATEDVDTAKAASWGTNMCVWTEFLPDDTSDSDGGDDDSPSRSSRHHHRGGCVARHTGYTNLQSGELNHRIVADTIVQLLRWENAVIGPVFALSST